LTRHEGGIGISSGKGEEKKGGRKKRKCLTDDNAQRTYGGESDEGRGKNTTTLEFAAGKHAWKQRYRAEFQKITKRDLKKGVISLPLKCHE